MGREPLFWLGVAWCLGAPALEVAGWDGFVAVRGWHMYHDVGRNQCHWGLEGRDGGRIWPSELGPEARQAFEGLARDPDGAEPGPLCGLGVELRLSCPDEEGRFTALPLERPPLCP